MARRVLEALTAKFGAALLKTDSAHGDEVAWVRREALVDVMRFLRDDPAMAMDLPCYMTCIDYLGMERLEPGTVSQLAVPSVHTEGPPAQNPEPARFELVYELRSTGRGHRVRVKVPLEEGDLKSPSLAGLWPAFNWLERECYDMYGVTFDDHPDLRRIYMYDEFVGYPLRKDYPKERRQPLVRREWTDE